MAHEVLLRAGDLPKVTAEERKVIEELDRLTFSKRASSFMDRSAEISDEIDNLLSVNMPSDIAEKVNVFAFDQPDGASLEMSLLVQHLRSPDTGSSEFRYLTGDAYNLLLRQVFGSAYEKSGTYKSVNTRVTVPTQQKSIQRVPQVDIDNPAIAVFMRAGLYPSLVVGKKIERLTGKVPDYALFRIRRNDPGASKDPTHHCARENLEYVLDYEHNARALHGKNVFIPEPMLATAGSLLAISSYLDGKGIKPASLPFLGLIGAFEGAVLAARHVKGLKVHLCWMDPALNANGYILPGLGDAGDLLNGSAENIDDLMRSYGKEFCSAHEKQVEAVYRAMGGEPPSSLF